LGSIVSERLKTCPGREQPLQSRRDFKSTGGVKYDPIVFLLFSKASGADGILSPPGFQFPVKELVACMKDLIGELHKLSFFGIIDTKYIKLNK